MLGNMRQVLCIAGFCLAGLAQTVEVAEAQTTDPLRTFANCAGRLSAFMEYQWMFDGEGSEQTQMQRAAMLDLIEATMAPDQARQILHWRISAKMAHAALLTRATFNDDPADALWAQRAAERLRLGCTSLLLS